MKDSGKTNRELAPTPKPIPALGEIYFVNLPKQYIWISENGKKVRRLAREMCGPHRCLIVQSADATAKLAYTIIIPISSARETIEQSSWVEIPENAILGIHVRSFLKCEQIRSIDKRRVERYVGKLDDARTILVQKIVEFLCPSILD